jgi:hypothetical protein
VTDENRTPDEPEVVQQVVDTPGEEPVGVFVVKVKDEQGNIRTDIQPIGVELTEIDTLLRLGRKRWLELIGLAD